MTQRILMAEDDRDIQLVAGLALRMAGYDVTIVDSGLELLERVAEVKPDIILLDWMMPGLDGPATLERLREGEATRRIPVIFLTAKPQPLEIHRGIGLGAAGYILKPFDVLTLGQQVRDLLAK